MPTGKDHAKVCFDIVVSVGNYCVMQKEEAWQYDRGL
jgi:hypothetical protein